MASAHVQHVVSYVCARRVVGDHRHTVGAVGAGRLSDVLAIDQSGGSHRIHIDRFCLADDNGSLIQGRDRQLKVKNRRCAGNDCDGLFRSLEFRLLRR